MKKSENEIAKIGFYRSFKSEILDFIVVYNIKNGFYRTLLLIFSDFIVLL